MQMPGRHPGRDARIHSWMPSILWQMTALLSNSSSAAATQATSQALEEG